MSNCNFIKIVPSSDSAMCTDHYSIASFTQGIFNSSALDLKRKWEITDWLNKNKNIVTSIECFLLKHPLFDIPLPLYPMFGFVHHSQIGFIFKDKEGKQIRHFCLQLQNGWWPPVSSTVPLNLAQPCKIINPDGTSRIETNLLDQTSIFGNFLESENYMAENIIEMNKYTNFKGIYLNFLNGKVNFNFLLESYRIWRLQNTDIEHKPDVIENFNFLTDYGQESSKLKGTGDGKLFVLNTFSPAYWSINEGTILHFATLNGNTDKFSSFIDWTFNNLQCYDNPRQHNRGYARTYNTLSTSALSLDWVKKNVEINQFEILSSCLRPIGKDKASWLISNDKWDPNGTVEKDYEKIMDTIANCKNLGQLTPLKDSQFKYDYSSCALVPTAGNYNCETYSSMVISMILNTNMFDNVDRKFNFNFPGANSDGDTGYTLSDNLMRMYAGYWPVAIYEDGYENGIFESDFNNSTDPNIIADRAEYAKQSMIFQYIFSGLNIEAADVTNNPVLKVLSELFTLPMLQTITGVLPKSASTMLPILNNMMYCIFLYEFLKVETVYLSGYKCNDINKSGSFDLYKYYDCEPAFYKFKIGTSTKRGVANSKLLMAVLKWITQGKTDLLKNFKLFKDSDLTSEQKQIVDDIENKFNQAGTDINNLYKGGDDCNKLYPIDDCNKYTTNILSQSKCEFTNFQNKFCISKNELSKLSNASSVVTNTVDGLLEIIKNRDIAVPLLKDLGNFVVEKADIFANVIGGNMLRFTTWCHQNYELNPNIMVNGSGNLIRRPDGICKDFGICALSNKRITMPNKIDVEFKTKTLDCIVNLTDPFPPKDNNFTILVIVIILLFLGLWVFLGYKTFKNNN